MNARLTNATNLLLICLLTFVPVIAGADTLERVRNSHSVVLGDVPDFAPFSTQQQDKASGYAIDLCLDIVDKIKTALSQPSLQVRYQPVPLGAELSAVDRFRANIRITEAEVDPARPAS